MSPNLWPKPVRNTINTRLEQEHCNLLVRRQHRPTEKLEEDNVHCKDRQGLVFMLLFYHSQCQDHPHPICILPSSFLGTKISARVSSEEYRIWRGICDTQDSSAGCKERAKLTSSINQRFSTEDKKYSQGKNSRQPKVSHLTHNWRFVVRRAFVTSRHETVSAGWATSVWNARVPVQVSFGTHNRMVTQSRKLKNMIWLWVIQHVREHSKEVNGSPHIQEELQNQRKKVQSLIVPPWNRRERQKEHTSPPLALVRTQSEPGTKMDVTWLITSAWAEAGWDWPKFVTTEREESVKEGVPPSVQVEEEAPAVEKWEGVVCSEDIRSLKKEKKLHI